MHNYQNRKAPGLIPKASKHHPSTFCMFVRKIRGHACPVLRTACGTCHQLLLTWAASVKEIGFNIGILIKGIFSIILYINNAGIPKKSSYFPTILDRKNAAIFQITHISLQFSTVMMLEYQRKLTFPYISLHKK